MKKAILISVIILFLMPFQTKASHVAGGEITYKYIGANKFEVTFLFYRDCRGSKLITGPLFNLYCPSGSFSVSLNPKLVSITDISNSCASSKNKCSPSNTIITSSYAAYEEFKFIDTLDFDGGQAVFKSCCTLTLAMQENSRTAAITTGPANSNFWITTSLDLCNSKHNSSPIFTFKPVMNVSCNQPQSLIFSAKDTIDGDSLSYSFTEPLIGISTPVNWTGGFNKSLPLSVYYPSGYNKSQGPNPNTNPPIGLYLDPETGKMIFTPTDCSEISTVSIAVKEWRKDSTGKYKALGETKREIQLVVSTSSNNHAPYFTDNSTNYTICEGQPFVLDIATNDKVFIPPPPTKASPPDTTTLTWNADFQGASFTIINPLEPLRTGRFSWTPPKGSIRTKPYVFAVKVTDNACPFNASAYKTIKLTVSKNVDINRSIRRLSGNAFEITINPDTAYQVSITKVNTVWDSSGQSKYSQYSSSKTYKFLNASPQADTFYFNNAGTYLLRTLLGADGFCIKYYLDTLKVIDPMELTYKAPFKYCTNQINQIIATVKNGIKPITYTWKTSFDNWITSNATVTDTTGILEIVGKSGRMGVILKAKDANGKTNIISFYINATENKPLFTLGKDTSFCASDSLKFKAKTIASKITSKSVVWQWMLNGALVNNSDSFKTKTPGIYTVNAKDYNGCYYYDTLTLKKNDNPVIFLKREVYCQDRVSLNQNELIIFPGNINIYPSVNWELTSSLKNPQGNPIKIEDLITDKDTSAGYDFTLNISKSKVAMPGKVLDSLLLSIHVTDTNGCSANDNKSISIVNSTFKFAKTLGTLCIEKTQMNLNDLLIPMGVEVKWMKVNAPGFDSFPKEGLINKGLITPNDFKSSGGKYHIEFYTQTANCYMGSVNPLILPNPVPKFNMTVWNDSVQLMDQSLNSSSRKWYVNGVLKSTLPKISFAKSFGNGKTIKLEIANASCSHDTSFFLNTSFIRPLDNTFVKIYPNPAHNSITLEILDANTCQIEILNTLGQSVLYQETVQNLEIVNLAGFKDGVYLIRLISKDKQTVIRFIKN